MQTRRVNYAVHFNEVVGRFAQFFIVTGSGHYVPTYANMANIFTWEEFTDFAEDQEESKFFRSRALKILDTWTDFEDGFRDTSFRSSSWFKKLELPSNFAQSPLSVTACSSTSVSPVTAETPLPFASPTNELNGGHGSEYRWLNQAFPVCGALSFEEDAYPPAPSPALSIEHSRWLLYSSQPKRNISAADIPEALDAINGIDLPDGDFLNDDFMKSFGPVDDATGFPL